MLEVGLSKELSEEVTKEKLASARGSGALDVYATPEMITMMEKASLLAVSNELSEGDTTVGTAVNIKHTSPTVLGSTVRATARLIEIDGRRLLFEVKAFDEAGEIGSGTHERFIVTIDKFLKKAESKKT
ncbi:MAG: thioesterase family protein [Lachnospiraceae bacterium]|nr:thioesterase family protein [Lachnospiraceae bacterium]MCR5212365.1 thioesterase family protein [Lachnospiraceae bacterium]